uniref:Putative vegetative cell wall protein gp1 n=1 Tax=Amblyomma triste TaxID=251400 RepID=A0A023G6U5_AMBTT
MKAVPVYQIQLARHILVLLALSSNLAHAKGQSLIEGLPSVISARGLTLPGSPTRSPPPSPSNFRPPSGGPPPPLPSRIDKYPPVFSPPGSPVGPQPRPPAVPARPLKPPKPLKPLPTSPGSPGVYANVQSGSPVLPGSPLKPLPPLRPLPPVQPQALPPSLVPPRRPGQPSFPADQLESPYTYRPLR